MVHRLLSLAFHLLAASPAAASTSLPALLEITEQNFDLLLRRVPFALVAFVAPTTETLFPDLLPKLESLAGSYKGTDVSVGCVWSHYNHELLDRFEVDAYPTILWFDGAKKWPFYASEATPIVYQGDRTLNEFEAYVIEHSRVWPNGRQQQQQQQQQQQSSQHSEEDEQAAPAPPSLPSHMLEAHECTDLSAQYRACMRHRRGREQKCADERHQYLLCMSGRWAVTPGETHREWAELYGKHFANGERASEL